MRAKKVMTVNVTTVAPQTSLRTARRQMIQLGVRHLPVVQRGRLLGLLSDRDLLRADAADEPVAKVMSRPLFTASPKSTVSELAHLMVDEKIDAVPITKRNRALVGLVTSSDLLQLLTDVDATFLTPPFLYRLRHAED